MKSIEKIDLLILECEKTRKKAHEDSNYKLRDFLHYHIQDLEKLKNVIKIESPKIKKQLDCNCQELTKNKELCPVHDKEQFDDFQNKLSKVFAELSAEKNL